MSCRFAIAQNMVAFAHAVDLRRHNSLIKKGCFCLSAKKPNVAKQEIPGSHTRLDVFTTCVFFPFSLPCCWDRDRPNFILFFIRPATSFFARYVWKKCDSTLEEREDFVAVWFLAAMILVRWVLGLTRFSYSFVSDKPVFCLSFRMRHF